MLQKGFTLIELMIVVTIIGILSMFALPVYQDYTKRTYVAEGLTLASSVKLTVTDVFSVSGIWPESNQQAGLPAASDITGQAVAGIGVGKNSTSSYIVIYYNSKVLGNDEQGIPPTAGDQATAQAPGTLTIAPKNFSTAGSVSWECFGTASGGLSAGMKAK